MKLSTTMLREKISKNLCIYTNFLPEHFYEVRSKAIRMAELQNLFLLQMENKKANMSLGLICFMKKKLEMPQINGGMWLLFVTKIFFFV